MEWSRYRRTRILAAIAILGCLIFNQSLKAVSLSETINEAKLDLQTWTIDSSDDNVVTFSDDESTKGSVYTKPQDIASVLTGASNPAEYLNTAIRVEFDNNDYDAAAKAGSLVTINFNNNGSISTKQPNLIDTMIKAHVYAEGDQKEINARSINGKVNQIHLSNTDIDLASNVNLVINANTENATPYLMAYTDISSNVVSYGYASVIHASNINNVAISVPVSLASFTRATATGSPDGDDFSNASNIIDRISASSVSNVIGSAEAVEYTSPASLSELTVTMQNKNEFGIGTGSTLTSFSEGSVDDSSLYSSGGSNVIGLGASYSYMGAVVSKLNTTLDNSHTLISSSITTSVPNATYNTNANAFHSSSGSNVVGLVLGYSSDVITISDLKTNLENANTLTSSSTANSPSSNTTNSYSSSGSNIMGLSFGYNSASISFPNKNSTSTVSNSVVTLADVNILTSSSTANSNSPTNSYSSSGSNIIGLSFGYNSAVYPSYGWGSAATSTGKILDLTVAMGDNNTLTSFSSAANSNSSTNSYSSSGSNVIGLSFGYNSAVYDTLTPANNLVGQISGLMVTLRDNNTLASSSSTADSYFSNITNSYSSSGSNVIGLSFGYGDLRYYPRSNESKSPGIIIGDISNLTITLGSGNALSSIAKGVTSGSSVIGIGYGHGAGHNIETNWFDGDNGLGKISGLLVSLNNDNILTSCACAYYSDPTFSRSGVSAVGAAAGYGTTMANCVMVNMNGSETIGALAYSPNAANSKVNVFGADNTNKGTDAFGWRVGIFATEQEIKEEGLTIADIVTTDSTVNIFGAKLGVDWSIVEGGVATATFGADQGNSPDNYARAFALGDDFQIYIGGRVDPANDHQFTPIPTNGKNNIVNIIGAICRGQNSTATSNVVPNSNLTIDNRWTVNAFGPVQGLTKIDIQGGAQWNVYEPTLNLPDIHVRSGVLHFTKDDASSTNFNDVIGQIKNKMTYMDPSTKTLYKGSTGEINIVVPNDYPWKGSSGGSLTLEEGHKLTLYVSGDTDAITSTPQMLQHLGTFKLVNGYVSIDAGMENTIDFKGGKIHLVDVNEVFTAKTTGFWLIRSEKNGSVAAVARMLGIRDEDFLKSENFTEENANLYRLTDNYTAILFALQSSSPQPGQSVLANMYPWLTDESAAYLFNDENGDTSGLFIGEWAEPPAEETGGEGTTPGEGTTDGSEGETGRGTEGKSGSLSEFYVNVELASLTVVAHTLLTNAISDRMTNVKGCLADPFIYAVYSHAHQDKPAKWRYANNMGGFVMGADSVWDLSDEKYLRLGIAFGYVHGKTKFSGPATILEKSAKHNIYMLELFGAYESFDDKLLKTNLGVSFGYGHGNDDLHRVNSELGIFDAKVKSHNLFLGVEFVKNLYAYKECQFGLWLQANYSYIAQKRHDETTSATVGAQHISAVKHNLLTTIIGLNIEREIINSEQTDEKWLLSLRVGWECQAVRKHSDATIIIDNNFGIGSITPTYGQPGRHAAIGTFGVSKKLNTHWNIVGSYVGRLGKDISTHSLSCGAEYAF
ncbi:MAG: autotransporter outer membrane beta-barrel domain-containing protein [Puniceicoccales bacterium]|jgi:hypothetical protein|nr:autotransporter outer membrane beta-barrel domain-containing protein [Puniceicoccales bacterium]